MELIIKLNLQKKYKIVCKKLTTLARIKLRNLSLLQLPSIISNAIIPSKDNAGSIVYLTPLINTIFLTAA
jgi:hypothetical protein